MGRGALLIVRDANVTMYVRTIRTIASKRGHYDAVLQLKAAYRIRLEEPGGGHGVER